ncbi:MAG: metallophosphoesterase family protein [Chloroflexi bacterium]|nr:metallophosphoesterase family protein [Chloroflexota bacterium]
MLYAIFSDVHNNTRDFERALRYLEGRGVDAYIQLGDLGREPFSLLNGLPIQHTFGNWEVSSLAHFSEAYRREVANWPAHITGANWIATHATPAHPDECLTTEATARYMAEHRPRWMQLFPSLLHDEVAIWEAFSVMMERSWRVAFHGHTHVQAVQKLGPDNRLERVSGSLIELSPDAYTLVGVGSLGVPRDGLEPRCVLFDPDAGQIELVKIPLNGHSA